MTVSVARYVPQALTSTTSTPTLSRGATGASVKQLQQALANAGFSPGAIDGDFGAKTDAAVKAFQKAKGLGVDGVVGPKTWSALKSGTVAPPPPASSSQPVLRSGDMGGDVRDAQTLLAKHGFLPSSGVDGQFGPQTRSAVVAFQRAKGLSADGVIGPATWKALGGTVSTTPTTPTQPAGSTALRQSMLDQARSQLGNLETGSNGGAILKYPNYFGRSSEAWCADFVSWVSQKSGGKMNNPYCPSVVNELKAAGNWKGKSNPQPGDLVLFDWDDDGVSDHIGLVEKVNSDGSLTTLEGNTSKPGGGQEGVWRKTRYMSDVMGFGNPY
jgi:peptidoglycan hydrolase-like protein with peptidoglycan-binding domain